jgi:hypothetical protein
VRNRFSAGNHESQHLESRVGAGIEPRVSIRGSGFHHVIFGALRKIAPTVETVLRCRLLSLRCPLIRLEGSSRMRSTVTQGALARLATLSFEVERRWRSRKSQCFRFLFNLMTWRLGKRLKDCLRRYSSKLIEGTHFSEDTHATHVICRCSLTIRDRLNPTRVGLNTPTRASGGSFGRGISQGAQTDLKMKRTKQQDVPTE